MAEALLLNLRVLRAKFGNKSSLDEQSLEQGRRNHELVDELCEVMESMHDVNRTSNEWDDRVKCLLDIIVNHQQGIDWYIVSYGISLMTHLACEWKTQDQTNYLVSSATILLDHEEVRVRLQVSELLQMLAMRVTQDFGMNHNIFTSTVPYLAKKAFNNWKRVDSTRCTLLGGDERVPMDDTTGWGTLESDLKALQAVILGAAASAPTLVPQYIQHTTICATSEIITSFQSHGQDGDDNEEKRRGSNECDVEVEVNLAALLITYASEHINRHLRENAFKFIAQLFAIPSTTSTSTHMGSGVDPMTYLMEVSPAATITATVPHTITSTSGTYSDGVACWCTMEGVATADRVHTALLSGLQDDWSQIRHAAALGCQSFLLTLTTLVDRAYITPIRTMAAPLTQPSQAQTEATVTEDVERVRQSMLRRYWPGILPRICMNRFYPAASIHSVSQNIWRTILVPNMLGRTLLVQYSNEVVSYYCAMTEARNHMTSEAACQALAEFIGRIDRSAVLPHIPTILSTLLACLKDDRWPVRDAAIGASGVLTRYFLGGGFISPLHLQQLIEHWTNNLTDFIWSVREHAAIAFGDALQNSTSYSNSGGEVDSSCSGLGEGSWSVEVQTASVRSAALSYIRQKLFYVVNEQGSAGGSDDVARGSKIKNFLPEALLKSAAKNKSSKSSAEGGSGTGSGNDTVIGQLVSNRKGWGCCIDCIELRTCMPWEVSHGAVYLLREVAAASPITLSEPFCIMDSESSQKDETLLAALVRLLDTVTVLPDSATEKGFIEGTIQGSQGNQGNQAREAHLQGRALLAAAVLTELPLIISTVVSASKAREVNAFQRYEAIQLTRVVTVLARVFRTAQQREKEPQENAASGSGGASGASGACVTVMSAAAKRAQQARLRSARGKDKVLAAAEKCLSTLPSALEGLLHVNMNMNGNREDTLGPVPTELIRQHCVQLVAMFSEDLGETVEHILR